MSLIDPPHREQIAHANGEAREVWLQWFRQLRASLFGSRAPDQPARAIGTTYTNKTGRPIFVSVVCLIPAAQGAYLYSGAMMLSGVTNHGAIASHGTVSSVIPDGAQYNVNVVGAVTIVSWVEL